MYRIQKDHESLISTTKKYENYQKEPGKVLLFIQIINLRKNAFTFLNGQKETGKLGTENEQADEALRRCGGVRGCKERGKLEKGEDMEELECRELRGTEPVL